MKKLLINSVYSLCVCCMAILMPFGLTACSGDDKPFVDNEPIAVKGGGDVVKGISVTLSDFESADSKTRTSYSDVDGGIKVTWAQGDTIGIFPNEGGQVEFPIQAGTESNEASFDGGGWALKSNSTYAAYYPYYYKNSIYGNKRIQLDYTSQKQAANGSTAHLGQYDYQATGGVQTNSSGYLNFQFKHLGALMVFNLTVPKAGTYTSLTLTSSEKVFVTKAELDISGSEPVLKATETSDTFTLRLDKIELASDNAELTAYLMLAPIDLSQGTLKLYLNGSTNFLTTLNGHSLESGKQYTINSSLNYLDYENIEFADDNVKAICVENWDTNGDRELSYGEAAAVMDIGDKFKSNKNIIKFDEFQYFTGLTSIGNYTFYYCSNLTSMVIPEGVTSIGNYAFSGCSSLTSIVIPESVTLIGKLAFDYCEGIQITFMSVNPPTLLESFYYYANWGSGIVLVPDSSVDAYLIQGYLGVVAESKLNEIINFADDNVKAICVQHYDTNGDGELSYGEAASVGYTRLSFFSNERSYKAFNEFQYFTGVKMIGSPHGVRFNSSLTSIVIPLSVTSIGDYALYKCSSLKDIVLPKSVTSIGESAFNGCSSLTSIEIPANVKYIASDAFEKCYSLTSIIVDKNNTYYDSRNDCNAIISTESNSLVKGCITTDIPANVTSIGDYAFSGCESLTNIVFPEKVTSIGHYAFSGCKSLTSIVIPEKVTFIGAGAFGRCSNLTSITCLPTNPPVLGYTVEWVDDGNFDESGYATGVVPREVSIPFDKPFFYVPASSVDTYKSDDGDLYNNRWPGEYAEYVEYNYGVGTLGWSYYYNQIQAIQE